MKLLTITMCLLAICSNIFAADTNNLTYVKDVLPIFMTKCFTCHHPNSLLPNWTDYKTVHGKRMEIKRRIWDSWSLDITRHYYKQPMPAGYGIEALAITTQEREKIKDWILSGAPYGKDEVSLALVNTNTGWLAPMESINIPNPIVSNDDVITKGKSLYTVACLPCHGDKGKGNGVAASSLQRDGKPILPADLTSANVHKQSDGSLFWKIKEGRSPMPSWKSALTDEQCWQVVDYIKSLNHE